MKITVEVSAVFDKDGHITPQKIYLNGQTFDVFHITDVRRAASLKSGGTGIRYTCLIDGRESYLFNDDGIWFVEPVC